jgi:Holliday junction resolvasome RuvABC endonuclease subunit
MRVHLCVDPGFKATGVAVYDHQAGRLVGWGCYRQDEEWYAGVKKRHGTTMADALHLERLVDSLKKATKGLKVGLLLVEAPGGSKSSRAAKTLGLCFGAVVGWARGRGLRIRYYTPQANKKAAAGDVNATKPMMEGAVTRRWPSFSWPSIPPAELGHVVDAAALVMAAEAAGDI